MALSEMQQKAIDAIAAGKATDASALGEAIGSDRKGANNVIGSLRRKGAVAYEMLHARAIDWSTIRVIGTAAASAPKRKRASKAAPVEREPELPFPVQAAPAAEESLEDSISVCFTRAEIDELERAVAVVGGVVAALKSAPKLGKDGATLMRLLAKVHGG